jgi:succinate-acetate transporter protein
MTPDMTPDEATLQQRGSMPGVADETPSTLRPSAVANPAPLGLCGFALTTFVLSLVNANVLSGAGDILIIIGLAVFYGGIAQLLAGMWEFRAGNTFGATAFTSFGAFWLSFAALLIPGFGIAFGTRAGPSQSGALGTYLIGWAIFTGIMLIGSIRTNAATMAVFLFLFLTFVALAIGAWADSFSSASTWKHIGGWLGVVTAVLAWYAAMAGLLSSVSNGKIALPVFPLA